MSLLLLSSDVEPVSPPEPVDAFTWSLEAELDGEGGGWTDLGDDVVAEPILCSYGILGSEVTDRTADTGTISFVLDNSENNSVGLLGAYSLAHSNLRDGFGFDIAVRLKLQFLSYTRYKFLGKMSAIRPVPGLYGPLITKCEAVDWMDDAARIDIPDLDVQRNLRPDELIGLVLDAIDAQPAARSLDAGSESYAVALDGASLGSKIKVREFLDQMAKSEGGKVALVGDDSQGGTLRFQSRTPSGDDVAFTFTDEDHLLNDGGMDTGDERDDVIGLIEVTAHPTREDSGGSTVLFSLQTTETIVPAGDTNNSLFGPYRDPSTSKGAFIGGTGFPSPLITPTVDYQMNTASDGSGVDLTADFTVVPSATGRGVRWTITNDGAVDGYITKLQLRGNGIYRSDVIDRVVVGSGMGRKLEIDMPLQNSLNVAHSLGTQLAYTLSNVQSRARRIKFLASESDDLMVQAILGEPLDLVRVQEMVTGINTVFLITRVTLEIAFGAVWCTYDLAPAAASQGPFWFLGRPGFSELGVSTILA